MNRKTGIIGYGSMGKMLLSKFTKVVSCEDLFVSSRTPSKIEEAPDKYVICGSNKDVASASDIVFICTRPGDIRAVLEEIAPSLDDDKLVISLNGSVTFETLSKVLGNKAVKLAKVIPSVTAEVDRSQTLVTYNDYVTSSDREALKELLSSIGNVIELPENEMGMGSELVSCMPGFIASMFDVICNSARKHTAIPREQIVSMVLSTLSATGELMLTKDMTFEDVVTRVATKGGITEVGSRVIYEGFPDVADDMFEKTLEKRRETSEKARSAFGG